MSGMSSSCDAANAGRCFRFAIDRGGTFTDIYAEVPAQPPFRVLKLLSEDPTNYADAPREGIRRILEEVTGVPHPKDEPLDTSRIQYIRMGTTVATNALLERQGEPCALVITGGFRDLLHIGNQSRPNIFDLQVIMPDLLYQQVVEVDERVVLVPADDVPALREAGDAVVQGVTGEWVKIERAPDLEAVRAALRDVQAAGIRSLAIVLLHAYTFPGHEQAVAAAARELGFEQVSLSSEVMPMVKIVPRGYTSCADAYLTPKIMRYIQGFCRGFDARLLTDVQLHFMQSDGGLAAVNDFSGHRAILSGPAGGVIGYARTVYDPARRQPVIGFDMGGTSTDVSRFDGRLEHVYESVTAGVVVQAPQLDINTVAAGGGSRLYFRSGMFVVGPDSAGAHPGPVCYRKSGPLAVTDANVVLGRIVPQFFPHIFGPSEREPLDTDAARAALQTLTDEVNTFQAQHAPGTPEKTVEEVALGFVRVANEAMCRPIRALTQMKGFDITTHVLACFGGAGGQHACAIARALGVKRILVHRFSGVLSAYGMALADVTHEAQEPCAVEYGPATMPDVLARLAALGESVTAHLCSRGFPASSIRLIRFLNLRYAGTDCAVMVPEPSVAEQGQHGLAAGDFAGAFQARYRREFGFCLHGRAIVVDDIRVRGVAAGSSVVEHALPPADALPDPVAVVRCYFEDGFHDTPAYRLADMLPGPAVLGPALILDATSTILVEPHCTARLTERGDVELDVHSVRPVGAQSTQLDAVQLSIFSHRFMGIAEQMGRTLQRTSISVNIKERLDFSCALFGPDGGLVANAPHIPVHLGAMQEAVRFQLRHWGADLHEGDVLVSNHPQIAGGSHLPDITVITPVFSEGRIVFWVASRGHHADIGGIAPGSMPPLSKHLWQEGAAIVALKLVQGGEFQEAAITEALMAPAALPGCSGCRNLSDSLSDLKAQVAANHKGILLVQELIRECGLDVVHAYMRYIQENAELAVRNMLVEFSRRVGLPEVGTVQAEDCMDDGTPIRLSMTIDRASRTAHLDFTGTGPEVFGNCNAPPAVTYSAVIYVLRCLAGSDIPLNQGCLAPITMHIPKGCILHPSDDAAVVGGNVLTSQRVVDVVLRAFRACAASQGCMNNFTFGDATLGYYETIAGGAGAGPHWHGRSGVHMHMTNTRITDPEILERRYPVVLRRFGLRQHSGGVGRFHGGDGVVRELEMRRPLVVSILSERRAIPPYGMAGACCCPTQQSLPPTAPDVHTLARIAGGQPGARGLNLVVRRDGRTQSLGGKNTIELGAGDRIVIMTPGGGGYGTSAEAPCETAVAQDDEPQLGVARPVLRAGGSLDAYRRAQESV